ncbi:MAG: gluconate 2-dehydrogenase subunit 3 family protein [Verrucomicrobia bacterium]|nr:gluconate 2-dehydrogenase subunit 3 family protein [Verrucomicrobiota bacterium]MDA1066849.1 gluconate 2-dehydrogenase subunit 3 family protein [Verrucomicrobiota bacterium]
MNKENNFPRINRREALKWIASAATSLPALGASSLPLTQASASTVTAQGYGPDPDLLKIYRPGDLWPLTLSDEQRRIVIALCDIIMPSDDQSPSASSLGVHDFVDEWISSPYPDQAKDRKLILQGLPGLDEEAQRQGAKNFVSLKLAEQTAICQELARSAKASNKKFPGNFFYLMRNLIAGGYYTTPAGMKDIGYTGNVARTHAPAPPPEALAHLGLKGEK